MTARIGPTLSGGAALFLAILWSPAANAQTAPPTEPRAQRAPAGTSPQQEQVATTPAVQPSKDLQRIDYVTSRYEPAGFPLFGGDTDTGVLLGAATSLTRFGNGVRPYLWTLNVVASAVSGWSSRTTWRRSTCRGSEAARCDCSPK